MRRRVATRTIKKAEAGTYYRALSEKLPNLGSATMRNLGRLLDGYRIRGVTEKRIGEIVDFLAAYYKQRQALPRRTDLRDRFAFLRFEDIPVLIKPPKRPFASRRALVSKPWTQQIEEYRQRDQMHKKIDKEIEKNWHGKIPDFSLVAVKLNWKYWVQNYFLEHGRLPTEAQVMPVVDSLIAFVKKHSDPKELTSENYAKFIGRRGP